MQFSLAGLHFIRKNDDFVVLYTLRQMLLYWLVSSLLKTLLWQTCLSCPILNNLDFVLAEVFWHSFLSVGVAIFLAYAKVGHRFFPVVNKPRYELVFPPFVELYSLPLIKIWLISESIRQYRIKIANSHGIKTALVESAKVFRLRRLQVLIAP